MSGSSERTDGREVRMVDAWWIAASVRLCENKGNRYNKTFAELMDNLRGEAGRRRKALTEQGNPLKRRRFRLQTKSAT